MLFRSPRFKLQYVRACVSILSTRRRTGRKRPSGREDVKGERSASSARQTLPTPRQDLSVMACARGKHFEALILRSSERFRAREGAVGPSINNVPDVLSTGAPRPRRRCVFAELDPHTCRNHALHTDRMHRGGGRAKMAHQRARGLEGRAVFAFAFALAFAFVSVSVFAFALSAACLGTPRTQDPAGRQRGGHCQALGAPGRCVATNLGRSRFN